MTEPTITCPKCKEEIRLTESLAAPLIEATRKQYQHQLAAKDEEIIKKEDALRAKEKAVNDAKRAVEQQVADKVAEQLKSERARVAAEESRKAKAASAEEVEQKARELQELQELLKGRDEKLAEAQKTQSDLIKKQRELDDAKRELELTVENEIHHFQICCTVTVKHSPGIPGHPTSTFGRPRSTESILKLVSSISRMHPGRKIASASCGVFPV